ncbi:MAG: outer membrane protein assembly factor BamD, partial [Tepidisphaerales bacterium]
GKRFIEARYRLAEAQLAGNLHVAARQEVEDLQKLMAAKPEASKDVAPGDVAWLLVRTYNLPTPGDLLEKAVATAREFAAKFPKHPNSVEAAYWIPQAYLNAGRADQAIVAYQEFIDGKGYGLPDGADATKRQEGRDKSPAEMKDEYTKQAVYQIAQIRFNQKEYAKAIEQWQSYVSKYPNGPQWASSQMEIINAEFQMALESVAAKKYDEARKRFDAFMEKHPLDARIAQILFVYGQIHYAAAQKLEEDKGEAAKITDAYRQAVEEWTKLVTRFPGTDQSSLAQYRIAQIHEEKLGDLEKAIDAYRKLNWGPSAASAAGRVAVMSQKSLAMSTERVFRSNEPVKLKLNTRNIEKLTVKMYRLDLESYFRKAHGIAAVESLDIALIQPDKTWELKVDNYAKYKPIEQELPVPFTDAKPGVCVINVSEEDLECTTLVMRSDIDLILKSSRREALVFVQDMLKNAGAEGVDLLFSDGQKIFATGKTGKDGVFRAKFDQLKDLSTIRVFAVRGEGDVRERHVAANMLVTSGLNLSRGLSPKGYLYTDRPAYRPGQPVFVGGVIRHVKDGSYVVPKGQPYLVSVTDPGGKLLWEEEKTLSEFGTLNARMLLDEAAAVGQYTVTARQKLEQGSAAVPLVFSGYFAVQQFQTEKMRLKLEPARQVYFRGESVELSITAEYYWGAPVAQKAVRYHLPDGRQFLEKTDDKGKLKVTFDTTAMTPGSALPFSASVEGENVAANTSVFLAQLGFNVAITTQQPLYLAGEPFEVTVKTTTPDGKPTGAEVNLIVLRRQLLKADPVLAGVPWVSVAARPAAEQTVSEQKVKTDEKTGLGTARLTLDAGGIYVLRATGKDRFQQVVTGEGMLTISDATDDIKLRFIADTDTLKVGSRVPLRLHSRLEKALALLTFEGEDILEYRILNLRKDHNDIELTIGHEHFPNFTISAAAMDSKYLRYAARSFAVQRELKVTVKPAREICAPGEEAKVEILVTDQLGKPVKAELSLAMVDEALLAVFADSTPKILDFFQADARRTGEFRIATSAGFAYAGLTRNVVKAFAEEADRIARGEDETRRIVELRERLQKEVEQRAMQQQLNLDVAQTDLQTSAEFGIANGRSQVLLPSGSGTLTLTGNNTYTGGTSNLSGNFANSYNNTLSVTGGTLVLGGQTLSNETEALAPYGIPGGGAQQQAQGMPQPQGQAGVQHALRIVDGNEGLQLGAQVKFRSGLINNAPMQPGPSQPANPKPQPDAVTLAYFADIPAAAKGEVPTIRREVPEAGFWAPAIVTDDAGKATVNVPMPQSTTAWRLTSRGCTVETLVGEATATVTTRKEFFVEIKAPASLQEGDRVRILARVHNLGDYEGAVDLALAITGDGGNAPKIAELKQTVQVKKQSSSEALFDAVDIPAAMRLTLQVDARAGQLSDRLTRTLAVRPWGLDFATAAGGAATSDALASVELPADRAYKSQWMTISVGPSMQRAILDLALGEYRVPLASDRSYLPGPPAYGASAGSELLGVVSALDYAKTVNAPQTDYVRLLDRARALVSTLVASQQKDGGWMWLCRGTESNWAASTMSFWALSRAKSLGIAVNDSTLAGAQAFLLSQFTKAAANDNDAKAVILHALSASGAADFANINRLYRERNILSDTALAYTALALANLNRNEIAGELLDLLATRARSKTADGRALMSWEGARSHAWLTDRIETTAVALLAIVKVKPTSDKAKEIAEFLLHERGCYGYPLAKSNGPAIAALAAYFARGKYAAAQYQLVIEVNGRPFKTIDVNGDQPTTLSNVAADLLKTGKNTVTFNLKGRGDFTYAVTLRGFSAQMKDPGTLAELKWKDRYYYHAPLEYRGRAIGAASTSPVANAEIGQRISVKLELTEKWRADQYVVIEEPLPAGVVLVDGSVKGGFRQFEASGSKITFYYAPGDMLDKLEYQLVGYATGGYRVLPTVVRDVVTPGRMRIAEAKELSVLAPGEPSKDPYQWNSAERFAMGSAYFNDGLYKEALGYLAELYKVDKAYNERELARMLLWIYASLEFYDAKQIVAVFEVVRERHPDLVIPFDKILVVGKAYRDIGEFERAWYVFRAVIDASFVNDSSVSAVLSDEGQFLASIDFQEELWREYPDTADVTSSYFALSQLLYQKAPQAHLIAKQERKIALTRGRTQVPADRVPNRVEMLKEALRMLVAFRSLYPDNPLADDAAFSQANALLELKDYSAIVSVTRSAAALYPKSEYAGSFQYMGALGYFWQRDYADALKAAELVANGASKDRDFARYIVGQIYHAQGKPASAIEWYHKVENLYPDAKEAIGYFEQTKISVDEVSLFKPGEAAQLKIKYRNIKEAAVRIYKVDLMKLYLREKNLANITRVNLSGITPEAEITLKLGDGRDYVEKEVMAKLPIKDEAAYLVICRGDDLFTSGVVLITPLKIEMQEDGASGRVRANVLDSVKNEYVPEVHVKAIGSADNEFKSGQTDLRGIFIADGLRGKATLIARVGDSRYAFYRGDKWIGPPATAGKPAAQPPAPASSVDFLQNLKGGNKDIQEKNLKQFEQQRRNPNGGVEIQKTK